MISHDNAKQYFQEGSTPSQTFKQQADKAKIQQIWNQSDAKLIVDLEWAHNHHEDECHYEGRSNLTQCLYVLFNYINKLDLSSELASELRMIYRNDYNLLKRLDTPPLANQYPFSDSTKQSEDKSNLSCQSAQKETPFRVRQTWNQVAPQFRFNKYWSHSHPLEAECGNEHLSQIQHCFNTMCDAQQVLNSTSPELATEISTLIQKEYACLERLHRTPFQVSRPLSSVGTPQSQEGTIAPIVNSILEEVEVNHVSQSSADDLDPPSSVRIYRYSEYRIIEHFSTAHPFKTFVTLDEAAKEVVVFYPYQGPNILPSQHLLNEFVESITISIDKLEEAAQNYPHLENLFLHLKNTAMLLNDEAKMRLENHSKRL
ncbi:hypothetical protein PHSC3_000428 [Chlamydiales bacterium STE3]|nr:hypothetical protein PHSC3_000428 [Chlamydiales bacterium STE3]